MPRLRTTTPEMPPVHAARAEFQSAKRTHRDFLFEPYSDVHLRAATEGGRSCSKRLEFLKSLPLSRFPREPGTAVFIGHEGEIDANVFVRVLASRKRLPERVLFVTTHMELVPTVSNAERVALAALMDGILLVVLHYGFNDDPDIPRSLAGIEGLELDNAMTRYYVTDDRLAYGSIRNMPAWQRWLFASMSRMCSSAAKYFRLPADRTTEIRAEDR
jgi:KUP system potassium uptake protein